MNAVLETSDLPEKTSPMPPDTLHLAYALKVSGRDAVVCDICGHAEMPYALHPDLRRNTAANFHRLMGLLLLEPALMQLNGFVNDLRRADIEARDRRVEAPPADDPPGPSADASDAAPDLAPEPPLKLITA